MYIFYFTYDCIAEGEFFDVAYRVMEFMSYNDLNPSDALIEEYRQSKTTKTLNRLPSYQELKKIGMEEKYYNKLKKVYRIKIIKNKIKINRI